MIRAFLYLYGTSVWNALRQRVRRLKQPKYLLGAIVGGAYFWFFVFRNTFRGMPARPLPAGAAPTSSLATLLEPLGAVILFVVVLVAWLLGNRRAALQFTEAEAAFLFPAPVARRTLIHFKLLRSQLGILVSAVFMTLIFRRGSLGGGSQLIHAAGWWLIFSTLNLHLIGASFTRERLLEMGINPLRRRLLVGGGVLLLAGACWLTLRQTVAAPTDADLADQVSLQNYVVGVLGHPPVSWILAPFALVVRPYLAATPGAFLAALAPALLLLAAHYLWVVRSDVSFEEASLELAAKRTALLAAAREGRWGGRQLPTKPKPEPFHLSPTGWAPLAYLWKNLLALGPFFRLRTWVIACVLAVVGLRTLGRTPDYDPLLKAIGAGAIMVSVWMLLFGPMFMRREIQQTLPQLDITKAYPLPGWQMVLGQLLTPMLLLTFLQWFLLLVMGVALGSTTRDAWLLALLGVGGTAGVALLTPPLTGLMLCIPYAGVLFFPAWAQASGSTGGGIEIMGQRLIFMAGYVLVLVTSLLPAALAGAVVYIIVNWLLGQAAAIAATGLLVSLVLSAELAAAIWWLGEKLERFDLSTEMPR